MFQKRLDRHCGKGRQDEERAEEPTQYDDLVTVLLVLDLDLTASS